ncbi:hypothetical protein TNCT_686471 [Trichonephila clavata]|uniref:Uncharacterized protein n=1 Tax=Trichonephila clavata TaxID=2740835 RepID=A0A8X6L9A8_TRICU|nr:hypothetical protein TNCT_686471 [Trichonephila clavata]
MTRTNGRTKNEENLFCCDFKLLIIKTTKSVHCLNIMPTKTIKPGIPLDAMDCKCPGKPQYTSIMSFPLKQSRDSHEKYYRSSKSKNIDIQSGFQPCSECLKKLQWLVTTRTFTDPSCGWFGF